MLVRYNQNCAQAASSVCWTSIIVRFVRFGTILQVVLAIDVYPNMKKVQSNTSTYSIGMQWITDLIRKLKAPLITCDINFHLYVAPILEKQI